MPHSVSSSSSTPQRAAFDLLAEGALWVEKGGKIRHANAAAAAILGYTAAQLNGTSYLEIDPNYSMLGWKKFWNRLDAEHAELLDAEFVSAAGSLFGVRGRIGFDPAAEDGTLVLVVFASTEEGRREADLLAAVEEDGRIAGWEYHLGTGRVYVAPQLRAWMGWSPARDFYPAAELAAQLAQHLLPSQQKPTLQLLHQLQKSARTAETTVDLQLADGQTRSLLLRARSVENDVEVSKIYGSAIREEDHFASLLPAGDDSLFQFTLDHAPEGVCWVDLTENRLTYVNARACEQTGYPRQELIGQPAALLLADVLDKRPLADKDYAEATFTASRQDGSHYPSRATLRQRTGEDGRPYAVIRLYDVSHEEAAGTRQQLSDTALDNVREWVVWLDADQRIVQLNAAARKKLGRRTSRDLEGLPLAELMPDLDLPDPAAIRQEQIDGRLRSDVDYVYADTNGKERTLQIRFGQANHAGHRYLSLIAHDVTTELAGRRRLQETKRRVDELRKQLESENEVLKEQIDSVHASGPIITVSPTYRRILAQIGQVAGTDATVLVTGETGTGKELLAQSIHNFSLRGHRRMVSVNCAALPEKLIESELFGHERGAFTGAFAQKKGKFELADGGTIFLDEIGELPLEMQSKLLRALQEGEIQRIGSSDVIRVDVRVVAATNRDLEQMIGAGTFREDLFYRLNVFPIHNLPLRERPEDIPVLVKHFTQLYARKMGRPVTQINQKDLEQLAAYDFPGNVRELINLVERAVITSTDSTLNLGASLRALRRTGRSGATLSLSPHDRLVSFEEMQRQYIREALRRTQGKITGAGGAAELLQLNGRTLMSKMVKLGIERGEFVG